jgi:hypothetical protein
VSDDAEQLRTALLVVVDRHARVNEQAIEDHEGRHTFAHCLGCLNEISDGPCRELAAIADALGADLSSAGHRQAAEIIREHLAMNRSPRRTA